MAAAGSVDCTRFFQELIKIMKENKELKATAEGIFQQIACGAAGTLVGGMLLGPGGALVGGIVGSLIGYFTTADYKSMIDVMINLSDSDKEKLVGRIQELVGSKLISDLDDFLKSEKNRKALIKLILTVE